MRYFCIGDEDTVTGFKLAGVEGMVAKTLAGAREAFKIATSTRDVGIVVVTEKVADLIREEVDKFLYSAEFPLIMEIPDRQGPSLKRKHIVEIVRQAVGIKV